MFVNGVNQKTFIEKLAKRNKLFEKAVLDGTERNVSFYNGFNFDELLRAYGCLLEYGYPKIKDVYDKYYVGSKKKISHILKNEDNEILKFLRSYEHSFGYSYTPAQVVDMCHALYQNEK